MAETDSEEMSVSMETTPSTTTTRPTGGLAAPYADHPDYDPAWKVEP